MVRRTKEEAQETRHRILDAAERVFLEHGVSRTSLQEIAQAAGVTRGAVYWHFKDKADVFNAMMMRVILPMEEAAQRSDDPGLVDPIAHVRESFLNALNKTANDPQVRRVFEIATHKVEYVDEVQAVRDRHLTSRNECLLHVERRLHTAMARGRLAQRVSPRTAAVGLHALVDGLIQNWLLDPQAFDLVEVGAQVLDSYLDGLACEASVSPVTAAGANEVTGIDMSAAAAASPARPSRRAGATRPAARQPAAPRSSQPASPDVTGGRKVLGPTSDPLTGRATSKAIGKTARKTVAKTAGKSARKA